MQQQQSTTIYFCLKQIVFNLVTASCLCINHDSEQIDANAFNDDLNLVISITLKRTDKCNIKTLLKHHMVLQMGINSIFNTSAACNGKVKRY